MTDATPTDLLTHFSVMSFWLTLEAPALSRICNGQSTKEPQSSTGLGEETVTYSIETTYFRSISTDFHKRCDLFWEQRVVSSNLTAPTIENVEQIELFAPSEKLAGVAFEGGEKHLRCHSVDCW